MPDSINGVMMAPPTLCWCVFKLSLAGKGGQTNRYTMSWGVAGAARFDTKSIWPVIDMDGRGSSRRHRVRTPTLVI